MSSLFISHSTKDKKAALKLYDWLTARGYEFPFIDSHADSGIPAGSDWQQHLYLRLRTCRAMVVLCSPNWEKSRWCFAELVYAKMSGKEIFAVVLDDCDLGPIAGGQQAVFVNKEGEKAYQRLLDGLVRRHFGPKDDFGWDENECPYPGLMAFEEKHAGVFFGREREIQVVLENLNQMRSNREPRFLMLVGASGSGKSSLLKAGILPRLRYKESNDWLLLPALLRHASRRRLKESLLDELPQQIVGLYPDDHLNKPDWKTLRDRFNDSDTRGAAGYFLDAIQDLTVTIGCPDATLLLAVDQFEELLQSSNAKPSQPTPECKFLCFLKTLFSESDNRVLGIGTMRADFQDTLERHSLKIERRYLETYRLQPFPVEKIAEVISKPLERTNVVMEEKLVEKLKSDTPSGAALPLLAFTLAKLYQDHSDDGMLKLSEYDDELGGIKGALTRAVHEALGFEKLQPDQEQPLRQAFTKHLVQLNENDEPVCRRSEWTELPESAREFLKRLAEKRLLIIDTKGEDEEPVVEVAHEALFREWDQLRDWIDESRQILRWRRDVERERASTGNDWRGLTSAQLATARLWSNSRRADELRAVERKWIDAGTRRLWFARGLVTFVCLVLAGLTAWALNRQVEAKKQAGIAKEETKRADTKTLAAQFEEGKAWLERARLYKEEKNSFAAAMMAAKGIGFQAFGGDKQSQGFRDEHQILIGNERDEFSQIYALAREPACLPIWQSPMANHHGESVESVAFSPDSHILASGSEDHTVKLWEVNSGNLLHTLTGHENSVSSVAFSPDGATIASASLDKTIKLWGVNTGELIDTLTSPGNIVFNVAFSPAGETLAGGGSDGTVKLWRVDTGKLIRTLTGHASTVWSVAFSPDGETLASASDDNAIKLWDVNAGALVRRLIGHEDGVVSVAFSPNGEALASASEDNTVRLWDEKTGTLIHTLANHENKVTSVAFSPGGETVASGSFDNTIKVWTAKTGKLIRTLAGHEDWVTSVTYSPDGETLASGGADKMIKVWQVDTGDPIETQSGHDSKVWRVAFSPAGEILASGGEGNTVKLRDVASGKLLRTLVGHEDSITSVAFSPGGETLATGSYDDTIKLWEVATGKLIRTLTGHVNIVTSVAFGPRGDILTSGSYDFTVRLWEVETGELINTLTGHENRVLGVAFDAAGETVGSASSDKTIKLWEVQTGTLVRTLTDHQNWVVSVAFGSSGETLASASADHTIKLWETQTGRLIHTLTGHEEGVLSLAFSPGGETLASASADDTIKLWEVKTGTLLNTLTGHENDVVGVALSPGGETVASASLDNTIKLWELGKSEALRTLTGHDSDVIRVAFGSGETIASAGTDNTINLWDVRTGTLIRALPGQEIDSANVAFSSDGEIFASSGKDNAINLGRMASGEVLRSLTGHADIIMDLAFSSQGETLASAGEDETIKLWNVHTGALLRTLTGHTSTVASVAFSPGGETLASASLDETIKLWAVDTGQLVRTLVGHEGGVISVAFGPGGEILASASSDKTVKLWAVDTGKFIRTLSGHEKGVWRVVFSPGGETLATSGEDKTIRLWESDTGQLIRTLVGHEDGIWSLAFSPECESLASAGLDNTIKVWAIDIRRPDLASYLSRGWSKLDGRSIRWANSSNNLYKGLGGEFLNVSSQSIVGIVQSDRTQSEKDDALFTRYLNAGNWNSALVMFSRVVDPKTKNMARGMLILGLLAAAESAHQSDNDGLAKWRLQQITDHRLRRDDQTTKVLADAYQRIDALGELLEVAIENTPDVDGHPEITE